MGLKSPSVWVASGSAYDCTGHIGALYEHDKPEWPMYSFDRPSHIVWNAIATVLHKRGWSDPRIKEWLQSKAPRWALDDKLGDELRTAAEIWANSAEGITDKTQRENPQ